MSTYTRGITLPVLPNAGIRESSCQEFDIWMVPDVGACTSIFAGAAWTVDTTWIGSKDENDPMTKAVTIQKVTMGWMQILCEERFLVCISVSFDLFFIYDHSIFDK